MLYEARSPILFNMISRIKRSSQHSPAAASLAAAALPSAQMHPWDCAHAHAHQMYIAVHGCCYFCMCHVLCVTQRKQQRPGIAKNNNRNDTNRTSHQRTMLPPNNPQTKLKRQHLSSDTPHIRKHSVPMNTQHTRHNAQAQYKHSTVTRPRRPTHTHPRPRQGCHNSS